MNGPSSLFVTGLVQEGFLVLRGSCVLIIEGQERSIEPWDFVHCPPRTPHTIVAAGGDPALVLAVGARKQKGSARYPVEPAAVRHGAGVTAACASPGEAYANISDPRPGPPPEIFQANTSPQRSATHGGEDDRDSVARLVPVAVRITPQRLSRQDYARMMQELRSTGAGDPEGRVLHSAYGDDDDVQIFEVWDSQESFDAHSKRLFASLQDVGAGGGSVDVYPVHSTHPD